MPDSMKSTGLVFGKCSFESSVVVPEGVTEIAEGAFYGNCGLHGIKLPSTLIIIGRDAFNGCQNLSSVDMSNCDMLEEIGEQAFSDCPSAEFSFPAEFSRLRRIGKFAFYKCKQLKAFEFPESLTDIYSDSFRECSSIQELDFSKCSNLNTNINYTIIYESGLSSLKKIVLPPNQSMFNALCVWKPNVHINGVAGVDVEISNCNSFKTVIDNAFVKMDIKEIVIPDTVETIEEKAFDDCEDLKTIVMPAALKEIHAPLGAHMGQLKKVDFSKVTHLKVIPKTFIDYGCNKLKELIIPQGVIEIEDDAFNELHSLKRLFLPPSLNSMGDLTLLGLSVFCFSASLEELEPIVYGWDDNDDDDDIFDFEDKEERKGRTRVCLYVLPQHLDSYIAQRKAERIPEDVLSIQVIPDEYMYYYDS